MKAIYDTIGKGYTQSRCTDPRIFGVLETQFGQARRILNIGAGTGSYEPADRSVIALEPSTTMIEQRDGDAAPAIQGVAEALPFADNAFDLAMGVLTIHHWSDWRQGLREARRVSQGQVVLLTWIGFSEDFWLLDYFPEAASFDEGRFPSPTDCEEELGSLQVTTVPIPHDCQDGFMCAYWRRPEAYLDPAVRAGISTFPMMQRVDEGLRRLEGDLASGRWHARHGHLLELEEYDFGYRLFRSGCP